MEKKVKIESLFKYPRQCIRFIVMGIITSFLCSYIWRNEEIFNSNRRKFIIIYYLS